MERFARIAIAAAACGMLVAGAICLSASGGNTGANAGGAAPGITDIATLDPIADEDEACRTTTVPEPACEAAWQARRRRFFGEDLTP